MNTTKKTILVIDDGATARAAAQLMLEDAGFHVVTTDDLTSVARLTESEAPDLVLMDVQMPNLEGEKLAQSIRSQSGESAPRILLYSGKPEQELQELSNQWHVDGFVQKTGIQADLVQQVSEWL